MTIPELDVVLVHRDAPAALVRSVGAFRSQGLALRLHVVDNASGPAALGRVERELGGRDGVELTRLGANLGFGPAANVGLRSFLGRGCGEWVAVAPHDAEPAPGCLSRLLAAARSRPSVGLASAEYGPGHDYRPVVDRYLGAYCAAATRTGSWQEADYPHGTLLLAHRRALEEVGLFDERYFAYCEEADLGLRARAAGFEVGIVWGAVVRNSHRPTGPVSRYLKLRNTLLLVSDHFGAYPATVRSSLALGSLLHASLRHPCAALERWLVEARALSDFVRGRFGPPPPEIVELEAMRRPPDALRRRGATPPS